MEQIRPVVIDTNCLVQMISKRSPYRCIWDAFLGKRFDDNKFIDCAFASGADYIVSEDSHFDVLRDLPFPRLNVLTMDEFIKRLP